MKKILLTGGAGFIGSHVNLLLKEKEYETHILDNLSRGSEKALSGSPLHLIDLSEKEKVENLLKNERFDALFHFAALTDVGESVKNPSLYWKNNVEGSLNLIHAMEKWGPHLLIFSSTASVYGIPEITPIKENAIIAPINPYGETKWAIEKALIENTSLKTIRFRYFNAAGGDSTHRLKNYKKRENNLIPLLINAHREKRPLAVFGTDWPTPDGTCIRDYIHVEDLANAHLLGLEWLLQGGRSELFNLGNGMGYSVLEVIHAFEKIIGQKADIVLGPRRPGDPAVLIADAKKAEALLGFTPKRPSLKEIVTDALAAVPDGSLGSLSL